MKQSISIIGGGAAGLALAAFIDTAQYDVAIYEKNKSAGRKFLVAGDGGFNLTHSESKSELIERYTPSTFLSRALSEFDNIAFRSWLESIGIETFVGSSKRVFPVKGIKPIDVLNAILKEIKKKKVTFHYEHEWTGWGKDIDLTFRSDKKVKSDIYVFALGGGSWKVTGSDGTWLDLFEKEKIETSPFLSSNCAYKVEWNNAFLQKNEGQPLKNISIKCKGKIQKGEVVITKYGLEGNSIYALSPEIRHEMKYHKKAIIYIDLKPTLDAKMIQEKLDRSTRNITDKLKKNINLSPPQVNLLKLSLSKEEYTNAKILSKKIKALPLAIIDAAPIDEAISTVGGVNINAVDSNFQLVQKSSHYCIGEMLDWDAPTGGYLLQACFSMGHALASHFNKTQTQ